MSTYIYFYSTVNASFMSQIILGKFEISGFDSDLDLIKQHYYAQ